MIPKGAEILYFDVEFANNGIYNVNQTDENFLFTVQVGSSKKGLLTVPSGEDIRYSDIDGNMVSTIGIINANIGPNAPVIKTDASGIDWVRVGFAISQDDSNNGGSVDMQNLRVIYEHNATLDNNAGFDGYLRQTIAIINQVQGSSSQTYIPVTTKSETGGQIHLANLEVQSEAGYDSTLTMVSNTEGLYQTGEIYHIQTTHNVDVATGAVLDDCRIQFKGSNSPFYLGYDLDTGFYELDDSDDYVAIHPSSSASQLSTGGIQVDWKFVVNGGWDDEEILIILSETLADNGVVGMLSGISLDPEVGNAVENDILVNGLTLYNSAGTEQELSQLIPIKYSNCPVMLLSRD